LKHIIAGIDPGKTAAIACLDLDGNVVRLATGRFAGLQWFVDTIAQTGSPVVIAGDKKRPDYLTEKLASIFDAVLFVPETDISVLKKKDLTHHGFANPHERDALAAARTAYRAYAGKLRQAERLASSKSAEADSIKAMVIKKYSVHEAVTGSGAGRRLVRRT
jgi:predicted RNase H-like nuclease (RuvC/YqgF family)